MQTDSQLKFSDFKNECERLFYSLQQLYPFFKDCRTYETLPYDRTVEVYKHDAQPRWWFIFEYMTGQHLIMTYNPQTNYTEFYVDEYVLQENFEFSLGGFSYGSTSQFSFGNGYVEALGQVSMYVEMLIKTDGGHLGNAMYVSDANNTDAWKNGDTPLEQDPAHLSFIRLLDNIAEAKKDPDPAWRGMQIEVRLKGSASQCDYLVKF